MSFQTLSFLVINFLYKLYIFHFVPFWYIIYIITHFYITLLYLYNFIYYLWFHIIILCLTNSRIYFFSSYLYKCVSITPFYHLTILFLSLHFPIFNILFSLHHNHIIYQLYLLYNSLLSSLYILFYINSITLYLDSYSTLLYIITHHFYLPISHINHTFSTYYPSQLYTIYYLLTS